MTTRSAELRALLEAIAGRRAPVLVALDGRSGTGKTTLADSIVTSLDAAIVQSDDFFAGGDESHWAALTPAERANACIDWRRLRTQALEPLLAGRSGRWHTFDFASGGGSATMTIDCKPATVILLDGAYSSRPELADLIGLSVLLQLPDAIRRNRLRKREGTAYMRPLARNLGCSRGLLLHPRPTSSGLRHRDQLTNPLTASRTGKFARPSTRARATTNARNCAALRSLNGPLLACPMERVLSHLDVEWASAPLPNDEFDFPRLLCEPPLR